ncbi:MAG: DoxX family protein [Sulfurospirillaceae bacterium]|nr:DoxX family protein [Sulfurospirillaceae bacterium]MDD3463410.1 DoxX family protein [Sulfurospirillaceae bacterium]
MKCYLHEKSEAILSNFKDFALLIARLTIAYGFYEPAINKWSDIGSVAKWFGTLGIPFPTLSAYLTASTELLGVGLLALGLLTRVISLPLIVVMIVAIVTVHLPNGFSAGANGFEIPFYYMVFLFIFASFGSGKISLDSILFKK